VTYDRSVVFSGTPVSFTNKTDRHDTTELLLKVALNTITLPITGNPAILMVSVKDQMSNKMYNAFVGNK
jgi:hypothetical protein